MQHQETTIWFITGSQHLYGPAALQQVASNSRAVVAGLQEKLGRSGCRIVCKPVVTTPEEIRRCCLEASGDDTCAGVIVWMHTFSPAKMWIAGLKALRKPVCHLHTQFNRDIPWTAIDMDFMNLNQSAHGDREMGHILTRLRVPREVVVGHWQDAAVQAKLGAWLAVVRGWREMNRLKVVRFGDNMREVAVTEGDKVEAQRVFGFSVNTHGVGDLVEAIASVAESAVDSLCEACESEYDMAPELLPGGARRDALREALRIEAGLRLFLENGGYGAFTDTFEDLHGLAQLPGLAVQRLMADGYGFGAEGDWKHAALVRVLKVMGGSGGTSFMEDYTYHFDPQGARCLGAHMLEICPSIAAAKPRCEIHPLGIGGKPDPVRLVFDGRTGPGLNVSLVDLGNRFRLLVNTVESVALPEPMPRLPVARVLWDAMPDLATAAEAWIRAGGAHHTAFSLDVSVAQIELLAEMAGVECLIIDADTQMRAFKQQIQLGEIYHGLRGL